MNVLTINQKGDVFLDFFEVLEEVLESEATRFEPLTHALVVARAEQGFLLMLNAYRHKWEVPGGFIDAGETPRQTAARELMEETGQVADLRFRGIMEFQLQPDGRMEYGALYVADLKEIRPFEPNTEALKIHLWSGEDIGYIDEIDQKLLELYM